MTTMTTQSSLSTATTTTTLSTRNPMSLYVRAIPAKMTRRGLVNLFNRYGEVVDAFMNDEIHDNGTRWGIVRMCSRVSALAAMEDLDGQQPLRLGVREAHTDEERSRRAAGEREEAERARQLEERARIVAQQRRDFDRTRGLAAYVLRPEPVVIGRGKAMQQGLRDVHMNYPLLRRAALMCGRYPRSEEWAVSSDADDVVDALNESVPLDIRSHNSGGGVVDDDDSAYVFGRPLRLPYSPPGSCLFCQEEGRVRCSVCMAWYCSQRCQREDWLREHCNVCLPIPELEYDDGAASRPGRERETPAAKEIMHETTEKNKPSAEPAKEGPVKAETSPEKKTPAKESAPSRKMEKGLAEPEKTERPTFNKNKPATCPTKEEAVKKGPVKEHQLRMMKKTAENNVAESDRTHKRKPIMAPAKGDTVKMGTRVVEQQQHQQKHKPADLRTTLANLPPAELAAKDEVAIVDFDSTTNVVAVQKLNAASLLEEIEAIMADEYAPTKKVVPVSEPLKGDLVACKWSDPDIGGSYYRARIVSVDNGVKRVKVQFLDYGNRAVEPWAQLAQLAPRLLDKKFPPIGILLELSEIPSLSVTEERVAARVEQVRPLLGSPVIVTKCSKPRARHLPYTDVVLQHEDGRTVNEIVKAKVEEPDDVAGRGRVQGQSLAGEVSYDKAHVAELKVDPEKSQQALNLHVESPTALFLTTPSQFDGWAILNEKIAAYVEMEAKSSAGFSPIMGHVCLAKASDDSWYRGVSVGQEENGKSLIFFPDFGFRELVARENILPISEHLMSVPFSANHCILEGFDQPKVDSTSPVFAEVTKFLVDNLESEVNVIVKQRLDGGVKMIRLPDLEDKIEEVKKRAEARAGANNEKEARMKALRKEMDAMEAKMAALKSA